ncbi:protein FAM83D isoform X1 [Phyllopteryx taeniolatus]|uniref:protein FAM83D isoform X1 n=1 Tax=Phyllopteryx taeniolatus TaxID=161469 RepID=UPI002AD454AE|nr:protein FAM83D isoform X1 [Phyllopteryx taeniolatus]
MALSQCLDDSLLRAKATNTGAALCDLQEVYNERHRLALEELLSGGVDSFLAFLRKESIANFLSDDELQWIRGAAVAPRRVSVLGEDQAPPEQSFSSSIDCSSVTYFPEVSDVEPPPLEIGWPAFTAGSYRGVTRAVAHFQPSYGVNIYACKEAARKMISSAREVIAIVTDSLTDLDIFKDLQEACSVRKVPVYILLDQSSCSAFLKMCRNISVSLDDLQQMRVRTITGTTYYTRSGARITGRVHERFMLIDGNRAATGSYRRSGPDSDDDEQPSCSCTTEIESGHWVDATAPPAEETTEYRAERIGNTDWFNWTDGKLNTSNLIELSGQITEKFDEEFRILYAQSLPLNIRGPASVQNSAILEHIPSKHLLTSSPYLSRVRSLEQVFLTSTPGHKISTSSFQPPCEGSAPEVGQSNSGASNTSTIGEAWLDQRRMQEEILACVLIPPAEESATSKPLPLGVVSCHVATQTSLSVEDGDAQTDLQLTQDPNLTLRQNKASSLRLIIPTQAAPAGTLKNSLRNLTKERQHHYSAIRSKLEHMMATVSQRRELADIGVMTQGRRGVNKEMLGGDPTLAENAVMVTWPTARCVH